MTPDDDGARPEVTVKMHEASIGRWTAAEVGREHLPSGRPYGFYLVRAAAAMAWVALCLAVRSADSGHSPDASSVTLLAALYMLMDASANAIYSRTLKGHPATLLRTSVAISVIAGLVSGVDGLVGNHFGVQAFGLWAIVSGALLALQGCLIRNVAVARLFLVISGLGSVAAGASFLQTRADNIVPLIQYAVGGAVWYAAAAIIGLASGRVALRTRQRVSHENPTDPAGIAQTGPVPTSSV